MVFWLISKQNSNNLAEISNLIHQKLIEHLIIIKFDIQMEKVELIKKFELSNGNKS